MKLGWLAGAAAGALLPLSVFAQGGAAPAASIPPAPALAAALSSVDDIKACMAKNYADRGSLRDITVTATDPEGKSKQLKLKLHWKPTKAGRGRLNLRVSEPLMLAGSTYLLVQEDAGEAVYFHLPAANKTQKVSGDDLSRPLWGTDFSYNDVKLIQGLLLDGDTHRVTDGKVGDRDVYAIETKPKPGTSSYPRVMTKIDKESCVILSADFYGKGDVLEKTFAADVATLSHLDPYWFVTKYSMKDQKAHTSTQLELSDVYLLERMPEKVFDPEHFFEPFE